MGAPDASAGRTPAHRRPWMRRLAIGVVFCGLAVGYSWPYFGGLDSTSQVRDWVKYMSAAETARRSLLEFGQLPQWDAWRCGGTPLLAEPAVDVFSPWFPAQLALGVTPAIRLLVAVHQLVALLGMFWWARRRGLHTVPALGAALAFGLSGFFAVNITWGYTTWLTCAYLPLVMIAYEAARERLWTAVGGGALLALMVLEGGLGAALLGGALLALRALVDSFGGLRRAGRAWAVVGLALAVGCGLAAPKLFPSLLLVTHIPLPAPRHDTLYLGHLFDIFLGRDTSHRAAGFTYERFQYFGYMGPLVFAAALWGLWRVRRAPFKEIYAVVGLLCLIAIGSHGPWLPYEWLTEIPLLRWMLAIPSRLFVAVGLFMALVFGLALQAFEQWVAPRRWGGKLRWLSAVAVVLVVADLLWAVQGHWEGHPFSADPVERTQQPFHQVEGDRLSQYQNLLSNQGTLRCHRVVPAKNSPLLRSGIRPQSWLEDEGAGHAELERFSPNTLVLDIDLQHEATVLINQNHAPGWGVRGDVGARVVNVQGLLALRVQPGKGRLRVHYTTPGLASGVVVAGIALLGVAVMWQVDRRRRARQHRCRGVTVTS